MKYVTHISVLWLVDGVPGAHVTRLVEEVAVFVIVTIQFLFMEARIARDRQLKLATLITVLLVLFPQRGALGLLVLSIAAVDIRVESAITQILILLPAQAQQLNHAIQPLVSEPLALFAFLLHLMTP